MYKLYYIKTKMPVSPAGVLIFFLNIYSFMWSVIIDYRTKVMTWLLLFLLSLFLFNRNKKLALDLCILSCTKQFTLPFMIIICMNPLPYLSFHLGKLYFFELICDGALIKAFFSQVMSLFVLFCGSTIVLNINVFKYKYIIAF